MIPGAVSAGLARTYRVWAGVAAGCLVAAGVVMVGTSAARRDVPWQPPSVGRPPAIAPAAEHRPAPPQTQER